METKDLKHIAIIMDGNGRWAKTKTLKRTEGHKQGVATVRDITKYCAKIGIKYLTLYAFSTENWSRPKLEVEYLMKLLNKYLKNELETLQKNNIQFQVIGNITKFSKKLQATITNTIEETKNNTGLTQILALNYGSQDEILRAITKMTHKNQEITKENLEKNLDTNGIPYVDMLIRTSGEMRLSNFLLWQCAYAELFFTPTLWPDFNSVELADLIEQFQNRERRFGGI
jgi:undecaprenyl diphosphate synthase